MTVSFLSAMAAGRFARFDGRRMFKVSCDEPRALLALGMTLLAWPSGIFSLVGMGVAAVWQSMWQNKACDTLITFGEDDPSDDSECLRENGR